MKTRVILASALLAALVVPAVAFSTTQTQTATVTIASAVGAGAGTNLSITGANPSVQANGTDYTNRNLGSTTVAFKGYSNKAGWTATGSIPDPDGAGAAVIGKLRGGITTANLDQPMSVGATCEGSFSSLDASRTIIGTSAIVGSGAKNTTEAGQNISLCFNQPISWKDGPSGSGTEYTGTVSYSLTAAP